MVANAVVSGEAGEFLLPMLLRQSFHDCVGGCDGCINPGNADNNGLSIPMGFLETLYTGNAPLFPFLAIALFV